MMILWPFSKVMIPYICHRKGHTFKKNMLIQYVNEHRQKISGRLHMRCETILFIQRRNLLKLSGIKRRMGSRLRWITFFIKT